MTTASVWAIGITTDTFSDLDERARRTKLHADYLNMDHGVSQLLGVVFAYPYMTLPFTGPVEESVVRGLAKEHWHSEKVEPRD